MTLRGRGDGLPCTLWCNWRFCVAAFSLDVFSAVSFVWWAQSFHEISAPTVTSADDALTAADDDTQLPPPSAGTLRIVLL